LGAGLKTSQGNPRSGARGASTDHGPRTTDHGPRTTDHGPLPPGPHGNLKLEISEGAGRTLGREAQGARRFAPTALRLPLCACRFALAALRLPLCACRFALRASRLPLRALRLALAALRFALRACRFAPCALRFARYSGAREHRQTAPGAPIARPRRTGLSPKRRPDGVTDLSHGGVQSLGFRRHG